MTKISLCKEGKESEEILHVAKEEGVDAAWLSQKIVEGKIVIPANNRRTLKRPCGIGEGLRTKVNANIGTSPESMKVEEELHKLKEAVESGADTVMDLSTGGDISSIRKRLLSVCCVPMGSVPIYEAAINAMKKEGSLLAMTPEQILDVIKEQAEDGIDFMTIHAGLTKEALERLQTKGRMLSIVSRGGVFLAKWMKAHGAENPLYEHFDKILQIAHEFDVTLSLGDGLRPGCVADGTDPAQIQELLILGELVQRCREADVQVMIEGPGHLPMNQIEANVLLEKRLCDGAPFYVLGPIVTDIAPGYDHIAGAIGGAIAAASGADFICYITPSEHLRLPTTTDVKEGVIAAKIAAHSADIVKGVKGAVDWDRKISEARAELDWESQVQLSIDPAKSSLYKEELKAKEPCTLCGPYCAIKLAQSL